MIGDESDSICVELSEVTHSNAVVRRRRADMKRQQEREIKKWTHIKSYHECDATLILIRVC